MKQGQLTAEDIVTHAFPLEDGPSAYRIFNDKTDGAVKIILKPWESGKGDVFKIDVADDDQDAPTLRD